MKDQVEREEVSYRRALKSTIDKEEIVNAVAKRYGKKSKDLYEARKKPLEAKKIAIYLLKRLTALTNKEIGETFGIGYSAVSKTATDIERLIKEDRGVRKEIDRFISHFKV